MTTTPAPASTDGTSTLADEAQVAARPARRRPDARVPRRPAARRSRRWSTTARGCSSCSAPAGASRRSTSSRPRCCARGAAGPTLIVSPLLALMRDQVEAAARAGLRAVTMNSANADEWAAVSAALAADEVDLLLVSPERLNNPRFRDEQLPAAGRGHRPARRRRGALHQRLGPRLPARLPADPRPARRRCRPAARCSRRRRPRTPGSWPTSSSSSGAGGAPRCARCADRWPARACASACCRCPPPTPGSAGWPRTSATCRAAASSTRSPCRPPRTPPPCSARPATRCAPTPGAPTRPTGSSSSGRCATTRSRPWSRPARWGWASTSPTSASSSTSAPRPRRSPTTSRSAGPAGPPSAPTCCCCRRRRTARSGATSPPRRCRAGRTPTPCWRRWPSPDRPLSTAALETVADVRRTRLELLLKVLDVEGAVRRVSGGWAVHRRAAGRTTRSATARVAAARDAEAASMLDYQRDRGLPDARSCRRRSTTRPPPTAAAATGAPGRGSTADGPRRARSRPRPATAAQGRRPGRARAPSGRAAWPGSASAASGRIAADERVEQGRVVARLTDLGWGQRVRSLLAAGAPDGPADDRLLAACVEVLAGWGWDTRPVGRRRDAVAAPARSWSPRSPGTWPSSAGSRPAARSR